jgi:SAM-dependent methyltransferase
MKKLLKASSLYRQFRAEVRKEVHQTVLDDPRLPGKFYPIAPDDSCYIIESDGVSCQGATLPCPPQDLWWGYGTTVEEYLAKGKRFVESMTRILQDSNFALKHGDRILDFGCGSGIMLRWLREFAEKGEAWGVDISGAHILWCQKYLRPPFKFATSTSFPHLPFEDNCFQLIYAGSVFTHIADLIEFWLLELRRILRPGGRLYLTVHDEFTIEQLQANPNPNMGLWKSLDEFDRNTKVLKSNYGMFAINRRPGEGSEGQAQVFYKRDYLRKHWGAILPIISMTSSAYGFQTAVVLEKR